MSTLCSPPMTKGGSCRYRSPKRASPATSGHAAGALECGCEAAALPCHWQELAVTGRWEHTIRDVRPRRKQVFWASATGSAAAGHTKEAVKKSKGFTTEAQRHRENHNGYPVGAHSNKACSFPKSFIAAPFLEKFPWTTVDSCWVISLCLCVPVVQEVLIGFFSQLQGGEGCPSTGSGR